MCQTQQLARRASAPQPAAKGEAAERAPAAGEGELVEDADDTVVVVFDFAGELLAGIENEGIGSHDDGRTLVAHIGWGSVLEVGLLDGPAVDDLLQPVKADLLANVELNQDKDRAGEVGSGRSGG